MCCGWLNCKITQVMKLATTTNNVRGSARGSSAAQRRGHSAFTLAECMIALLFVAIVIPAAVEALHVASGAGEIAVRKGEAAHVADRVLNESLVMTNWNTGS